MNVAEAAESRATASRVASLDGLRGLAVAAVVFVHYTFYTGLLPVTGSGYLGVAVFFVLSGYLITRIVWRGTGTLAGGRYGRFVRRRLQRLYPALTGMLVIATPLMAAAGPETLADDVRAAGTAFLQLTAFADVIGSPVLAPWAPTWSLTVEWVFYLSWPLVLAVMGKRATALQASCLSVALGLAFYAAALPLGPTAFYVLPVANLGVMMFGAALALLHVHREEIGSPGGRDPQISSVALLLFLMLVLIPGPGSAHPAYRWLLLPSAVIAALFIIDQRPGTRGPARWFLESRVMRGLGIASYSIYLWHLPLLWIVWFRLSDLEPLSRAGLALCLLLPVVWLSFRLLERPWLHLPANGPGAATPRSELEHVRPVLFGEPDAGVVRPDHSRG